MEIKSLEHVPFPAILRAFERAFADYETQFDAEQLRAMLKRRGFCPHLSFAACDNGEIAAFTLNGTGTRNGMRTAYDTGTGTLCAYRGQGLAQKIFRHSIPLLKRAGIQQYLLEVLQHNAQAVALYRKLGFETTREFHYAVRQKSAVRNRVAEQLPDCRIAPIGVDTIASLSGFRDFTPSWQNDTESIRRAGGDLVCLGAFAPSGRPTGYCVFDPRSGDLTQIAVDPPFRRRGIASRLLQELLDDDRADTIRAINSEIPCPSLDSFLSSRNITPSGKQFEMVRPL